MKGLQISPACWWVSPYDWQICQWNLQVSMKPKIICRIKLGSNLTKKIWWTTLMIRLPINYCKPTHRYRCTVVCGQEGFSLAECFFTLHYEPLDLNDVPRCLREGIWRDPWWWAEISRNMGGINHCQMVGLLLGCPQYDAKWRFQF